MKVKVDSMGNDAIRKRIKEKYYQYDLCDISTAQLIKNEAMIKSIGGRIAYPFKEAHDPFATTGIYKKYHDDGEQITIIVEGSLSNGCVDIFEEERKLNKVSYHNDKQKIDETSDTMPDVLPSKDKIVDPRYQLANHESFDSWVEFIMD